MSSSTESSPERFDAKAIPRIDLNLEEHKRSIAVHWAMLVVASSIVPVVLYFALRYGGHLSLTITLAVTTATFGVFSILSLIRRTWFLMRAKSDCLPLGGRRWGMDYFNWNFIIAFIVLTIVISLGNSVQDVRVVSLSHPILLIEVSAQLLIIGILRSLGVKSPLTISSAPRGEVFRSGVYAIAEDIVAVDGKRGRAYRIQLQERYFASSAIREVCCKLDLLWGVSGVCVGGAVVGVIFGVSEVNVGYALGWTVPLGYAGVMSIVTTRMVKAAKRKEETEFASKLGA